MICNISAVERVTDTDECNRYRVKAVLGDGSLWSFGFEIKKNLRGEPAKFKAEYDRLLLRAQESLGLALVMRAEQQENHHAP